jgi:hypothetical protein
MGDSGATDLLRWAGKYGRFLATGRITDEEFAAGLLDQLAVTPRPDAHLAGEMLAALPAGARTVVEAAVRMALVPGYRHGGWHYGGPRQQTAAERETESALLTARVRSWTAALAAQLGGASKPEPGAADLTR